MASAHLTTTISGFLTTSNRRESICRSKPRFSSTYFRTTCATLGRTERTVKDTEEQGRIAAPVQTRRELFAKTAAAAAVLCAFPPQAQAGLDLDFLVGGTTDGPPKGYIKLAKELVKNLRTSLEVEASGAKELKVRAKADPAKENIQTFIREWKGRPEVSSEISYQEITGALRILGEFYAANGQRAKLPQDVIDSVLDKLAAAQIALNPEP
mmetsp:Transcript_31270/g.68320  ORF Transcript_31270/g.68320 Transcript_31270/m.68320 type:complete len:211 (+) Transcript_31270:3-635(+)